MTARLSHGMPITWHEGKKQHRGTVEATWNDGAIGYVRAPDGEMLIVHAAQLDKSADTLQIKVDMAHAQSLAMQILSGVTPPGSVTEQAIHLAAALMLLLDERAA